MKNIKMLGKALLIAAFVASSAQTFAAEKQPKRQTAVGEIIGLPFRAMSENNKKRIAIANISWSRGQKAVAVTGTAGLVAALYLLVSYRLAISAAISSGFNSVYSFLTSTSEGQKAADDVLKKLAADFGISKEEVKKQLEIQLRR